MVDPQGVAPSENDGVEAVGQGVAVLGEGNTAHMGVQLTREQKVLRDKAKGKIPSAKKNGGRKGGGDQKKRHKRHLATLSRP